MALNDPPSSLNRVKHKKKVYLVQKEKKERKLRKYKLDTRPPNPYKEVESTC